MLSTKIFIKSAPSFFCLSILFLCVSSCSRPINCLIKKCESTTQIPSESSDNGATAGPSPAANPSSPGTTDAIAQELKTMKERDSLLLMIDSIAQKLSNTIDVSISKLEANGVTLQKARQEIDEKRQEERRKASELAVTRKAEYEKTISNLDTVNQQISTQKFQIISGIEAIESGILDPLTPEGVKTQIELDQKLGELDLARDRSDKALIEKIRGELKQFVGGLLVADKSLLNNLIDQLAGLSVSLVDANAPSQIANYLRQLLALEDKINAMSTVEKPEVLEQYRSKIEIIKKAMQAPISTLAPWQIDGITKIETGYQTAVQTAAALDKYIVFIDSTGQSVGEKIVALKNKVQDNRNDIAKLKSAKLETPSNLAFIQPSLGALAGVYDKLQVGIEQLNEGTRTALGAQLKPTPNGPDPKSLESFTSAQVTFVKSFEDILKAQSNLVAVFASKSPCSLGQPVKGAPIPLKEISCSGQKLVIVHP